MIPKTKLFILLLLLLDAPTNILASSRSVRGGAALKEMPDDLLGTLTYRDEDEFKGEFASVSDGEDDPELSSLVTKSPVDYGRPTGEANVHHDFAEIKAALLDSRPASISPTPRPASKRFSSFFSNSNSNANAKKILPINTADPPVTVASSKKCPSPREEAKKAITEAFTTGSHKLNRSQLKRLLEAYTTVFPLPQSHPEQFSPTLPLVAQLAAQMVKTPSYELSMNNMEMWELLAGFVYTTDPPVQSVFTVINNDATADAQFNLLLRRMAEDDPERMAELRERARRQVVRSVGAGSTIPLEASDSIAEGSHLRVLGTQRALFYRPELLSTAAILAATFDSTQAPEIFNFLVRQRCSGVWGPRRDELGKILKNRSFLLDEREFPKELEELALEHQFGAERVKAALRLIEVAAQRDAKLASSHISLLSESLRKQGIRRALRDGRLEEIINACSAAELDQVRSFLREIAQEGEDAMAEYERIRERVLRSPAVMDKRTGRCLSRDLRAGSADRVQSRFDLRSVSSGGVTSGVSSGGVSSTSSSGVSSSSSSTTTPPGSARELILPQRSVSGISLPAHVSTSDKKQRPLSARIQETLARLSPVPHQAPIIPSTAQASHVKTLDDVIEGALRVIEAVKKSAVSEEMRRAAHDDFHLRSLKSFFSNSFGHQSVRILVTEVLHVGCSYSVLAGRGGEFLYAAYLLTLSKRSSLHGRLNDSSFTPMMDELRNLHVQLAKKKNLFDGVVEWDEGDDQGIVDELTQSFSDDESDGEISFAIKKDE